MKPFIPFLKEGNAAYLKQSKSNRYYGLAYTYIEYTEALDLIQRHGMQIKMADCPASTLLF